MASIDLAFGSCLTGAANITVKLNVVNIRLQNIQLGTKSKGMCVC